MSDYSSIHDMVKGSNVVASGRFWYLGPNYKHSLKSNEHSLRSLPIRYEHNNILYITTATRCRYVLMFVMLSLNDDCCTFWLLIIIDKTSLSLIHSLHRKNAYQQYNERTTNECNKRSLLFSKYL